MRPANIATLGIKELHSLGRDPVLLVLIVYAFSLAVYAAATAFPDVLARAPISIVDEDASPLSKRIVNAFYPPLFAPPSLITTGEMDKRMDDGTDTFALDIPPDFQRDVLGGRSPSIQLNIDATRMTQAYSGSGYVQSIVAGEIETFLRRYRPAETKTADVLLVHRVRYNPLINKRWFYGTIELVNMITMLSIILTGAALIREREHGTIEHLLAMPVTPFEIMASKIWAMAVVVLAACGLSLLVIIRGVLDFPFEGSAALFLAGAALDLFATTSLGILLGTVARSMPQFGLLMLLVLLPLNLLSGGFTPYESMPQAVQFIMLLAPTTHFVALAQGVLFRGADLSIIWPQFLALAAIGSAFFFTALVRFRSTIGTMA
jgi:ABC-2 type transport system permease protein